MKKLDTHEITILNAARSILKKYATDLPGTASEGRVTQQASVAEWNVFGFLNSYNAWTEYELSAIELHGAPIEPEPEPEPQSIRV